MIYYVKNTTIVYDMGILVCCVRDVLNCVFCCEYRNTNGCPTFKKQIQIKGKLVRLWHTDTFRGMEVQLPSFLNLELGDGD